IEYSEKLYIVDHQMTMVPVCHECNEMLSLVINKTSRQNIYLHLDLNVLDPVDFDAVSSPVPGGFRFTDLLRAIEVVNAEFNIVGCSVIGYHPRGDEDAAKIKTLIGVIKEIMA
ncbi:MAG: arginase family protein, partial [Sphaerochaetaceae bacterium]